MDNSTGDIEIQRQARLQKLGWEMGRLSYEWNLAKAEYDDLKREPRRLFNTRAPVNRIPNEILGKIFVAVQTRIISLPNGYTSRYTSISQVLATCFLWREIALNTPSLWTFIKWRKSAAGRCSLPSAMTFLERSGTLPIELEISFEDRGYGLQQNSQCRNCIFELLEATKHRCCRRVTITLPSSPSSENSTLQLPQNFMNAQHLNILSDADRDHVALFEKGCLFRPSSLGIHLLDSEPNSLLFESVDLTNLQRLDVFGHTHSTQVCHVLNNSLSLSALNLRTFKHHLTHSTLMQNVSFPLLHTAWISVSLLGAFASWGLPMLHCLTVFENDTMEWVNFDTVFSGASPDPVFPMLRSLYIQRSYSGNLFRLINLLEEMPNLLMLHLSVVDVYEAVTTCLAFLNLRAGGKLSLPSLRLLRITSRPHPPLQNRHEPYHRTSESEAMYKSLEPLLHVFLAVRPNTRFEIRANGGLADSLVKRLSSDRVRSLPRGPAPPLELEVCGTGLCDVATAFDYPECGYDDDMNPSWR